MPNLDIERDTIFIPVSARGPDDFEIPNVAYALAPRRHPANFLGIPAQRLHPSRYDATKLFLESSHEEMFSWMSLHPYEQPCWKIDLSRLNPKHLRLYNPDVGHLIYRGSIPSIAVVGGVGLPRIVEDELQ